MKKTMLLLSILSAQLTLFAQDTIRWGDFNSRTEYRNNAGLQGNAGALSGFFQTAAPVNYPAGATGNWHLLDVRHSNPVNNFAMQFAGSFFDQDLYFRKTSGSPTTPWSKVITSVNGLITIPGVYNFERFSIGKDRTNGGAFVEFVNHSTGTKSYGVRVGANRDRFGDGLYITAAPASDNYDSLAYGDKPAIFVMASNNAVGIGTNNTAGYQLAVAGSMIAARIKVKLAGTWPDYVFDEHYPLLSLDSTAAFVRQYKHLPDMPSAKTIAAEGLDVEEMNAKLLRKVEELTLYLIEQHNTIEILKKENEEIKAKISVMNR